LKIKLRQPLTQQKAALRAYPSAKWSAQEPRQPGPDQNQYLPLVITCADNEQFVILALRPGNVHAALGAGDDLVYLVSRLCRVWPEVVLYFRGDCDFGVSAMYDVCEKLRVGYTFGFGLTAVLQRQTEALLAEAVDAYQRERRQGAGNRTRSGRRWSLGLCIEQLQRGVRHLLPGSLSPCQLV
jgi:hypothetical protein